MQKFGFIEKLVSNVSSKAKRNVSKGEIIETLFEFFFNALFVVAVLVVLGVTLFGLYVGLF